MDKKEFGRLVAALRRYHIDESGSFWTQARLGEKTGLGEIIIGKIERGERANLDTNTLLRLASALNLTSMERKDFFTAAVGISGKQVASEAKQPGSDLADLVTEAEQIQLPVFISDVYGDIIVANSAIRCLLKVSDELIHQASILPIGFNMMHFIFAEEIEFSTMMGPNWDMTARQNVLFFRRTTLCYRSTAYFNRIFTELQKHKSFRSYWYSSYFEEADIDSNSITYNYVHPDFGYVHYLGISSDIVTKHGNLYLNVYAPGNSNTSEVFAGIIKRVGTTARQFAPWPKEFTEPES